MTALSTSSVPSRIEALDALRGLAIIMVVIGHYVPPRLTSGLAADFLRPWALGGVILFFLLSGFLIENNLRRQRDLVVYGLRRIFRIAPAYVVSVLCFAVLDASLGRPHSVREIVVNAALLQDVLGVVLLNPAFWTLLVETKFYLIAPAVMRAGDMAIRAAPYLVMALNATIFARRGEASNLLLYMNFCLIGMNFGLWYRGGLPALALGVLCAAAALSMLLFAPYLPIGTGIFVCVNCALLAFALLRDPRIPALAFVGAISYSWYLYHGGFGYPLMAAMEAHAVPSWASACIAAVATLIAAWVSYRLIERPAINLGRALERGWRGAKAPSIEHIS